MCTTRRLFAFVGCASRLLYCGIQTASVDLNGAGYLLATLLSVVVAAWYASRWAKDALSRVFVGVLGGLSVPIALALILGMAGVLSRTSLLVAHIAVAFVALIAVRRTGDRAEGLAPRTGGPSFEAASSVFVGTGLAVFSAIQTLRGRATGETDSRSYHLANLVEWYRSHSIWDLPFQNLGFFTATHPGNGELLGIAAIAATGGEQLAYLVPIVFGLLAVLACASIARDLGVDSGRGALASLAVIAAPVCFATQANSLATDLAAAAGLLAAVACLLRVRVDADARWLLLAGVALGLGLGSKYTVFVPVAFVALAALIIHRLRALWLAPGLALFAAPWLIRNAVTTGNPIFPQGVEFGSRELLPAGESPLLALSTSLGDHVINARTEVLGRWVELAARNYGPVLLLIAVGVLAVLFKRSRRGPVLAVAGITLVALAGYMFTPFTGAGEQGLEFLMGSNLRYALPAVLLGAALAAATLPRMVVLVVSVIAIGYDALKILQGAGFRSDLNVDIPGLGVAGIAAVIAIVVSFRWPSLKSLASRRKAAFAVLGLAAAVVSIVGATWSVGRSREVTELEQALQTRNATDVIVLGVEDLRSVLGPDLDVELKLVSGGGRADERPFDDAGDLNRALRRADDDVLVVLPNAPAVPKGWQPSREWRIAELTDQGTVYVREDS